jgi:hypothetical protein
MAQTESTLRDVRFSLTEAERSLDRFALEFESLPEAQREQLMNLWTGVKKLQLATSHLVEVVTSLDSRMRTAESPPE